MLHQQCQKPDVHLSEERRGRRVRREGGEEGGGIRKT
jgi:hypothetical protein